MRKPRHPYKNRSSLHLNPTEEKKDGPLRTQADENQETKDPSEWGPGEMISEARNAVAGGAIDAYNSIYSAPARWHDMSTLSPEEFEEKRKSGQYDMPWLQDVEDPIVKTWWGNLLKGVSHYSTLRCYRYSRCIWCC